MVAREIGIHMQAGVRQADKFRHFFGDETFADAMKTADSSVNNDTESTTNNDKKPSRL